MLRIVTPSSRSAFSAAAWIAGSKLSPSLRLPSSSSHISRSIALPKPCSSSSDLVEGRVPVLEDVGPQLVALDQDADLVVGGEVHRAEDARAAVGGRPLGGGVEQGRGDRGVLDRLEEAEHRVAATLGLVPALVDLGGDPPDRLAVALGDEVLGLAVLEPGVLLAVEELHPLEDQRRHPLRMVAMEPEGDLDEALQVAPRAERGGFRRLPREAEPTLCGMSETAKAPVDVFEKARSHDRLEQLEAAKQHDLLPYFRLLTSQAGPVVEMEGRETIMLGSNNYLGLTGDERVKQGGARRAGDLRHRRHRLAAAERDDAAARRARARAGAVDGDRGGDRLHDRLPGQRRLHRHDPRAGRHGDLRLRRPRLDPRRLQALRGEAAPLPPQPHGQAGEDAAAGGRGRRRRAGRRRRRLLDGGRRLRPAADRRALPRARGAADGRRGARRRRARRARRRCERAVRARGRGRPADGDLLQEPRLLRRLHRRPRRRDRVPADRLALLRLQRLGGAGGGRRRAGGPAGDPLRRPATVRARCSPTPSTCARGCATSA